MLLLMQPMYKIYTTEENSKAHSYILSNTFL